MQAENTQFSTISGYSIASTPKTPKLSGMTHHLRHFVNCLVLPLLSIALMASPIEVVSQDRIEAFLTTTGFDVAMESIALGSASAPQMLGIDPDGFGSDWVRLTDVFDTEEMHGTAVSILEQTLSDEALYHAASFYASHLGQRLVVAENAAHLDEDDNSKQQQGQEIVSELIEDGSARVESLKRMNRAVDASGTSLRALQEIQIRFLLAASASGIIELNLDSDELREMMRRNESELQRSLQISSLARTACTYNDFSDSDVDTYVEALEHPLMQEAYEPLNATRYEIMAMRFEILAARMIELRPVQDI